MHALGEAVELDWGRYVVLALIEPLRGFSTSSPRTVHCEALPSFPEGVQENRTFPWEWERGLHERCWQC